MSLAYQGKEIKQRIRYYFTTVNLQKLKSQTMSGVIKDMDKGTPCYMLMPMHLVQPH